MIRLLLEDTGLPYTFHAVENWPAPKNDRNFTPMGQLPVLHHNGFALGQSNSILRYIATTGGRVSENNEHKAWMDMILDSSEDLRVSYARVIYGGNYDGDVPKFVQNLAGTLGNFERFLEKHGVEYFGFGHFSYPDVSLWSIIDNIRIRMAPDCLSEFPLLHAWFHRVSERHAVKEYLKSEKRAVKVNGNDFV